MYRILLPSCYFGGMGRERKIEKEKDREMEKKTREKEIERKRASEKVRQKRAIEKERD